jgi:hypothetical protein
MRVGVQAGAMLVLGALGGCPDPGVVIVDGGIDARIDARPSAACDPGCHWDCFGGSVCEKGFAWVLGTSPYPCCHYGDPWPTGGPTCGYARVACDGDCLFARPFSAPARYQGCLKCAAPETATAELLGLYCPRGVAKEAGAPCEDDDDCRPAADGLSRLSCDAAGTHTCVDGPRPEAPADYGASCGLGPEAVSTLNGEMAITWARCPVCQVARAPGSCLRQGCTTTCTFDEDCPEGSVCLCPDELECLRGYGVSAPGYCAAATGRDTPEQRAAGLRCW